MQLFLAPVNGLYGVLNSDGFIGPDETGELYGAAGVFFFVIAIGIFITMAMSTGAIDNGVARIAQRMSTRGPVLIAVLMVLFSIGGTTEGMAEETLGFYALVVPLVLALGYDRMVAAAIILVGRRHRCARLDGQPVRDRCGVRRRRHLDRRRHRLRFLMYVVLVPVGVWWVLRYARKVKADPSRLSGRSRRGRRRAALPRAARGRAADDAGEDRAVHRRGDVRLHDLRDRAVGAGDRRAPTPTATPGSSTGTSPSWRPCSSLMSIVVGLIGGLGEKRLTDTLVKGAGDFIGVGLIIVLARGVTVIMNNSEITDTILNSMERARGQHRRRGSSGR